MFAVPGWDLDAGSIKTQEASQKSGKKDNGDHGKSKKRKRVKDEVKLEDEDLSRLWGKHVKQSDDSKEDSHGSKKRKKCPRKVSEGILESSDVSNAVAKDKVHGHQSFSPKATLRKERKEQHGDEWEGLGEEVGQTANVFASNKDATKAESEKRKTSSLQRKERKAHLRASGEMPPQRSRPEAPSDSAIEERKPKQPKLESVNPGLSSISTVKAQNGPSKPKAPSVEVSNRSTAAKDLDALLRNGSCRPKPSSTPRPSAPSQSPSPSPSPPPSLAIIPPAPPKLTPLQQKMRQKLISARFRHLNQTLYTSPSSHSANLFASSPDIFASYHAGFEAQVAVWPQNPVDLFVRDILQRGRVKGQGSKGTQKYQSKGGMKGKKQQRQQDITLPSSGKLDPLPRTAGTCHIADLGCGNASLAASLQPHLPSLNLHIQSFDLAKPQGPPNAELVTIADITSLSPKILGDASIDLVICCLSLMPTNWPKIVDTAARVLRVGGEAWVAEVRSRFARRKRRHGGKADDHSVRSSYANKDGERGDDVGEDMDDDDDRMVDEVEDVVMSTTNPGSNPKKGRKPIAEVSMSKDGEETDLAPFIEVWKRRGMEVREVDQENKMFVGVKFVKRRPFVGKGEGRGKREVDEGEEAKVLKPCVYKLR